MVTLKFHSFEMMGSVWAKMLQSYGLSPWIIQEIFSNSNQNNGREHLWFYSLVQLKWLLSSNCLLFSYTQCFKSGFIEVCVKHGLCFSSTTGVLGSCFSSFIKSLSLFLTNKALNCCLVRIQTAVYCELLFPNRPCNSFSSWIIKETWAGK